MCHVRPAHPSCQHGYSLSSLSFISAWYFLTHPPITRTHYFPPFFARGVAVIIKATAVLILNVRKKALEDNVVFETLK
jgi:hypothetical protein